MSLHDERAAAERGRFEVGLFGGDTALATPFSGGLFFIVKEERGAGNRAALWQFQSGSFGEVEADSGVRFGG